MYSSLFPGPRPEAGLAARSEPGTRGCVRLREEAVPLQMRFLYRGEGCTNFACLPVPPNSRSIGGDVVCGHLAHLALWPDVDIHRLQPSTSSDDDDLQTGDSGFGEG